MQQICEGVDEGMEYNFEIAGKVSVTSEGLPNKTHCQVNDTWSFHESKVIRDCHEQEE